MGWVTRLRVLTTKVWSPVGRARVVHVGQFGDFPGGMAQVVNIYLGWSTADIAVSGWRTTRRRRDPKSLFLTLQCVTRLFNTANRTDTLLVIHLSQRGSFIREGAIALLARLLRWNVSIQLHGSEFATFASRAPRLVAAVVRSASSVYVLSEETAAIARSIRADPTSVKTLVNVVSVPSTPEQRSQAVVFGGVVGRRKGADVLLESWKQVNERLNDWRLIIAGPIEPQFAGVELPRCEFTGPLHHEDLQNLLAKSRVAILPSRGEALPMFLLEAMANGLVPIGTRVGSVPDLLEGVGICVQPGDVNALTKALLDTCESPDIEERSAASRQRIIDNFSESAARSAIIETWTRDIETSKRA